MIKTLILMFFVANKCAAIDRTLMINAMNGQQDARLEIALILSDSNGSYFNPEKSHEIFLELAQKGVNQAIEPLANAFSDPLNPHYSPSRAVFYLERLPTVSPAKVRFYKYLAGKLNLSDVLNENRDPLDPFDVVISSFAYYPFTSLNSGQLKELKLLLSKGSGQLETFEKYIFPSVITPIIANSHLYQMTEFNLDYWYFDKSMNSYIPLVDSKGVKSVSIEKSTNVAASLTLNYNVSHYEDIKQYYAAFLKSVALESGTRFFAPGVVLDLILSSETTKLSFTYEKLPRLIPSRK